MWQWFGEHLPAIGAVLVSFLLFFFVKRGPKVDEAPPLQPVPPPLDSEDDRR